MMKSQQRTTIVLKEFNKQLRDKINQKNSNNINDQQFIGKQFKYFDVMNKGRVNFDQFSRAIEKIGVAMNEYDLKIVFNKYDISGDNELDFKEFATIFAQNDSGSSMPDKTAQNGGSSVDPYIAEKNKQTAEALQHRPDTPVALLKLFRDKLRSRGPRGMVGLQRIFKVMDDDNSGSLSVREFTKACKEFKVGISEQNVPILFNLFDENKDGTLDYDEFLYKIRGDISPARMDAVEKAFTKMDQDGSGIVDINVIKASYDAKKHPDVVNGKRTEQNVLCEYLETFEAHHLLRTTKDDVEVTQKEFVEYYKNISACIDSDRDFFLIIDTTSGMKQQPNYKRKPQNEGQPTALSNEGGDHQYLPKQAPQNVIRSGMGSSNNPLNTTHEYYPPVNHAARGSATTAMNQKQQQIDDNQSQMSGQSQKPRQDPASHSQYKSVKPSNNFMKVQGPSTVPKFQSILVERFRKALKDRGGRGIVGLARQFKIFDDNGSGDLDIDEFTKAIQDFQVQIEEIDIKGLFKSMDLDHSGTIDFNEFLRVVVGEMSQFRQNLVEKAFKTLDYNMDGDISIDEFHQKYNAKSHPDVKQGKRTEEEVLVEFMETFQQHHNNTTGAAKDDKISLDEFIEYYNNISCNIENDQYFDLMITNAWGLEGDASNPANMPFAGSKKKIQNVNSREAYRQDHHRNLFGTDEGTPFNKNAVHAYQSASHGATQEVENYAQGGGAGSRTEHNQGGYAVDYTGIKHENNELIENLRAGLAKRGARGMIGLQRIFKIMDDDHSGTLSIQEFWKACKDFRIKISQDECRQVFDLFDENDDGELDYDELIVNIRGVLNPFRKQLITKAFNKLDADHSGTLEVNDIKQFYNAKQHPDVKAGKKTEDEVLIDFLETFDVHRSMSSGDELSKAGDGKVTLNEFMDYYSNVSASIDDDQYFQLMITNAWNLDDKKYGKAWAGEN